MRKLVIRGVSALFYLGVVQILEGKKLSQNYVRIGHLKDENQSVPYTKNLLLIFPSRNNKKNPNRERQQRENTIVHIRQTDRESPAAISHYAHMCLTQNLFLSLSLCSAQGGLCSRVCFQTCQLYTQVTQVCKRLNPSRTIYRVRRTSLLVTSPPPQVRLATVPIFISCCCCCSRSNDAMFKCKLFVSANIRLYSKKKKIEDNYLQFGHF